MKTDIDTYMDGSEAVDIFADEGNVIDLQTRKATGGPTRPENWLERLAVGVTFACKPRTYGNGAPKWLIQELQVINKYTRCTELAAYKKEPFLVDTKEFCLEHELVEVIHNPYETDP